MYLLDTDTLSLVHFGNPRVLERQKSIPAAQVGTTVITRLEIVRGRSDAVLKAADGSQLQHAQLRLLKSEDLLRRMHVLNFDAASCLEFDRLLRSSKLRKIGRADLLIAAIALSHKAILVTRNLRHFQQVPGLRIENWAD